MGSEVQSVIFKKRYWTITRARQWLKRHGFRHDYKVDIKPNFYRFRQTPPSRYRRYIIKHAKPSVELVIGFFK